MTPLPKITQLVKMVSQRVPGRVWGRQGSRGFPGAALTVPEKGLPGGAETTHQKDLLLPVRPHRGSLTGDAASHVHAHGDSEAKTQVDTKKAPHLLFS